jgi:hypothetical protein
MLGKAIQNFHLEARLLSGELLTLGFYNKKGGLKSLPPASI